MVTAALMLTIAPAISGQAPKTNATDKKAAKVDATVRAITDLEHRWAEAFVKKDATTLRTVLAPTYHDTDESGNTSTLDQLVSMATSPDAKVEAITITDIHVATYGKTAVVTGTATQRGSYKGQAFAPKVVFTDTFVKRNGQWQAVASQRTAVR
jgi:ketosteroid isomerase-like protein